MSTVQKRPNTLGNSTETAKSFLPASLETLGDRAFNGCRALSEVYFRADCADLEPSEGNAFVRCSPDLIVDGVGGSGAEKYACDNGLRFEKYEERKTSPERDF